MKDIIELAEESQNRAWEVIRDAKIIDAWTSIQQLLRARELGR